MKTPFLIAAVAALIAIASPAAATSINCPAKIKATVADIFQHGPFEMTSTMEGLSGPSLSVGQIIPGKAMHSHTDVGGFTGELTIVDGRMWRRSNDGPWAEAPLDNDNLAQLTRPAFFDVFDEMLRPRCLGLTEVDGVRYFGYSFGFDLPDIGLDVTVYVDPATDRVARVHGTTVIAGDESTSTTLYRYDPTLTVTAPQ